MPESVLKRQKKIAVVAARAVTTSVKKAKALKAKRKVVFQRAEKYAKEYKADERSAIRLRRQARMNGNFYVEPEAKLAFVIRIRGINRLSPKVRTVLRLLRLLQINNGVFVRLNKATLEMLKLVEPYVAWGYPNHKAVKELVYKRGFGKVSKQRIPLTNNQIVETTLGQYDVLCMEDIIHEIVTVGSSFKQVNNFLWPFKLNSPRGGILKRRHFNEGGDYGNREEKISQLIHKMI